MRRLVVLALALALVGLLATRASSAPSWCAAHHVRVLRGMTCSEVRWILSDPERHGS